MARTTGSLTTKNGITWYYEQEGSGPDIVLVPDGIGECALFSKPMSLIAGNGFRVTTFDMPGMSRSHDSPPETWQKVTPQKLASYVISIVDELGIDVASFWGCSSGGSTMLALLANYPSRVRNAMAHEVPTYEMPALLALETMTDEEIRESMSKGVLSTVGDTEAWDALGDEVHDRMFKNWARWGRGYPRTLGSAFPVDKNDLKGKPLDWSVGGDTPTRIFFDNIITATELGVPFCTLPGRHFPYVTHVEEFAAYVVKTTRKYL